MFDLCGFCGGDLYLSDASEAWVFTCQTCHRETILSDQAVELIRLQLDPDLVNWP